MMWRVWMLAGLGLSGCFEGDLGRIVFDSNLWVDGVWWTPEAGVVDGQVAQFRADKRVGGNSDEVPDVTGSVRGGLQLVARDGPEVTVSGRSVRGRVSFDGEVADHFHVRFAAPEHGGWIVHPGLDPIFDTLGVIEGAEVLATVAIRDRRGRPLGWSPDSVELVAEGGLSIWATDDAGVWTVSGDVLGPHPVVAALGAEGLELPSVRVVAVADLVDVTREERCDLGEDTDCPTVPVGWTSEGLAVYGLTDSH